nr:MAG TPA: hypothetical protein [Caudoviricetes sp.]
MRLRVILCPNLPVFEEFDPRAFETRKGSHRYGLTPPVWWGLFIPTPYISHNQGGNHAE